MATHFTFVPVNVGDKKSDYVAPDYRSMIRSLSARNPWNRPLQGESVIPGLRAKPAPLRAASGSPAPLLARPLSPNSSSSKAENQDSAVEVERDERAQSVLDPKPAQLPDSKIKRIVWQPPYQHELPDNVLSPRPDPLWMFPIPYRGYMSPIVEYKLKAINRHIPLLDDPSTKLDRSQWALSRMWVENRESPTFLYATLLHAGCFLALGHGPDGLPHDAPSNNQDSGAAPYAVTGQEHLLWLRLSAIRSINADLQDPTILHPRNSAKFGSLLGAIATLAAYEFYFGDRHVQRAHHKALARLVTLHGGLDSLDELHRRFYLFVLEATLLAVKSGNGSPAVAQCVATTSALRDLLREPARELGCDDLDALLGPEES